jgi:two-component system, response regulator
MIPPAPAPTLRPDILLVEDSEHDAELTLRVLKRHNPATRVVWVKDGAEALEYVFGEIGTGADRLVADPRVVVVDIKMPRMDGHEVLRRIKADARSRHIPVVIMSSSRVDQDIADCFASGANSYVVKPVGFDQFSEAVRQIGRYWLELNEPREAR